MTEPTQSGFDEKLARFARGSFTAEEARELAQDSLNSHAWFEELTATAMARTAVSSAPLPSDPVRQVWWRSSFLLATAAVLALGVFVAPYVLRDIQKPLEHPQTVLPQSPPTRAPVPTLAFAPGSMQPILLAENLQLDRDTQATPVFRGFQEGSRAPRAVGRIISIEEGQATINLGSLDGLSKGSLVEVFRDSTLKDRVGNLHVKTVFREQARGQFESNGFESGYAVRVTDRDHLQALEQQASDLANRRDVRGARLAAAKAREWASAAALSISQKAGANELLAKLDFKANNVAAAEIHYRAALDMRTADPHGSTDDLAEVQNDLAALLILRGDYDSAERLLDQKPALASRPTLRAERLNNLGVLVETRGDRKQAESLYIQALAAFPKNNFKERNITKANLDRVKGPH